MREVFGFCGFFIVLIRFSIACEGLDMRTTNIHNCGDENQIIKVLPNSSIFVNEKCEIISNVCTDVKPFSRGSGILRLQKNTVVIMNTTHQVCDTRKANEMVRGSLAVFGVKGCSMPTGIHCDTNKKVMTFSTSIKTLRLLGRGNYKFYENIRHDTGFSCFEAEMVFKKI